ncbi:thiolase-like protein, partial [Zopfochytrium polystomum]
PVPVGSVKGHVGHGECMSGVLSVIKCALMLSLGEMYPTANCRGLSPKIAGLNVAVQTAYGPFPRTTAGRPRRVAVNSFGFGGSNAHAVLEQAP